MSYYNIDNETMKALLGRKLKSVKVENDREQLVLCFQDGKNYYFNAVGDCCSSTWIEHLEELCEVDGAVLLGVHDSDRVPYGECNEAEYECLQVYHTTFTTDRGEIILEYRNSSNGYYGGSLSGPYEVAG